LTDYLERLLEYRHVQVIFPPRFDRHLQVSSAGQPQIDLLLSIRPYLDVRIAGKSMLMPSLQQFDYIKSNA
jgi:hypothetical protein